MLHKTGTDNRPPEVRFTEAYRVDPSGCWIWIGAVRVQRNPKTRKIYCRRPAIRIKGKLIQGHRLAYQLYRGPIPPGAFVCHSCDNTMCVNPDHLWLGDNDKNQEDKRLKGRSTRGEKSNHAKLVEADVRRVRTLRAMGYSGEAIAREFGISGAAVSEIVNRHTWRHIE